MRRLVLSAGVVLLCAGAHAECLKAGTDDQVAEGKLTSVIVTVPDYKLKEQAYILKLATPACLDGKDEYDKVDKSDRIHVFSLDGAMRKRLRSFVGKPVRVHGSPFGEENLHHHAPIVMSVSAVEPLRTR
jgi:hypothetical protein